MRTGKFRQAAAGSTAAIALVGLAMAGAAAQPASASTVPVIYATFGSWQHPQVRPHTFGLGANWWLSYMRWSRWSSQASGHRYYSAMKITSRGHRTIRLTYQRGGWFQS